MRAYVFVLLGLLLTTATARADILREPVPCSVIAEGLDGKDRQQIGYAVQYLADRLAALDEPYVQRKRPSLVKELSEDGMINLVAMIAVQCRKNLVVPAREAARTVYEGMRALQSDLGIRR